MTDLIPLPLLRNSERKDFKTCQAKWNWAWNFGLKLKIPTQSAAWFGTGWHLVWAEYYTPPPGKDGFTRSEKDPHETWAEYCKGEYASISSGPYWDEVAEKEWHDAETLGHIMIDNYLEEYGNPADPHWEVLMPEQRFRARIPLNARQQAMPLSRRIALGLDGKHFITDLRGTFDMPVRDHSFDPPRVVVVDHKTTNKKENVRWLTKDDQSGTYITIGTQFLRRNGLILPSESVWGAIWSYARKGKKPDDEILDSQGRKRNKPEKKHYAEQLDGMTIAGAFYSAETLMGMPITSKVESKMTLEKLAQIAGVRVLGEVSKQQPSPLFWREPVERGRNNRMRQLERIADDAEQMAAIRNELAPVTKNPGEHCNWCQFSDLCDLDENGDETDEYIKAVYDVVDPYADHREGARNSKETVQAKKATGVQ
ncbi:exonuclease [Mycobacterium phage DrLupo]|uniref:Exonuclease n=1 Tax=Mycobacterium phage DrLupo TaxID=2499037 RepID=A0A3S9UQP9_9CAUD|nr:exonuclease [Mycobacterium phage DrLupo]AZS12611.1 exonuclease [Mycobacterium phage DrLupo]